MPDNMKYTNIIPELQSSSAQIREADVDGKE